MRDYNKKLKHILPTFLIVTLGTTVGLLLIRWLFSIEYSIVNIKEEFWLIYLPIGFPWIPIIIWLRPRFRILTFKRKNDDARFFFQVVSWLVMFPMLFLSQSYLTTATGKLQTLNTVSEINSAEYVRYYSIERFVVAPEYAGNFTDFRTSGKYSQYLNFNVYFAVPILSDSSEIVEKLHAVWYGIKFDKQISNNISITEKQAKYEAFFKECLEKIKYYNFYGLEYFERRPNSEDRTNFLKSVESIRQTLEGELIILEPVQVKYSERNGDKLKWIFGSYIIALSVFLLLLLWPGYSEHQRKRFLSGKKPKDDEIAEALNYLIPKGNHFSSSIILDINILVFLLMTFSGIHIISPNGIELLEWGANRRIETLHGDWWRLITNLFVHCNKFTLGSNRWNR